MEKVVQGDWNLPQDICLSNAAVELLSQLLSYDPQQHGFARGLFSTHTFFREVQVHEDQPK